MSLTFFFCSLRSTECLLLDDEDFFSPSLASFDFDSWVSLSAAVSYADEGSVFVAPEAEAIRFFFYASDSKLN